jgi:hypothetical protein
VASGFEVPSGGININYMYQYTNQCEMHELTYTFREPPLVSGQNFQMVIKLIFLHWFVTTRKNYVQIKITGIQNLSPASNNAFL